MNYRRIGRWAAAGLGVAAAGAGLYWLRERSVEKPDHRLVTSDGDYEVRRYPALLTAEAVSKGGRDRALGNGFGLLADYIFAEGREGEEIAMTAPVIAEVEPGQGWRVRFVMPRALTRETLPEPTQGVSIGELPARRIAAVRFGGRVDDALLAAKTEALQGWMEREGLMPAGPPQHAFYNSPFIPGPLRQNEVWIEVA
jgi:hypothetical protein